MCPHSVKPPISLVKIKSNRVSAIIKKDNPMFGIYTEKWITRKVPGINPLDNKKKHGFGAEHLFENRHFIKEINIHMAAYKRAYDFS